MYEIDYEKRMHQYLTRYTQGIERQNKDQFLRFVIKFWEVKKKETLLPEQITAEHIKSFDNWRNKKSYRLNDLAIILDIEGQSNTFDEVFKEATVNLKGNTLDRSHYYYMSVETAQALVELLKKEDLNESPYLKLLLERDVYIPVVFHVVSYSFLMLHIYLDSNKKLESDFVFISNKDMTKFDANKDRFMKIPIEKIYPSGTQSDLIEAYKSKTRNKSKKFSIQEVATFITNQEIKNETRTLLNNQPIYHLHPLLRQTLNEPVIQAYKKDIVKKKPEIKRYSSIKQIIGAKSDAI